MGACKDVVPAYALLVRLLTAVRYIPRQFRQNLRPVFELSE